MGDKKRVFLLLFIIAFFSLILLFVLDRMGIIEASSLMPFLKEKNKVVLEDRDFPSEVEKLDHRKKTEKLMEWQELLARKDEELKQKEEDLKQKTLETEEIKKGLNSERKRLSRLVSEWNDRQKKVQDLAQKVRNMPPEKAKEMMEEWTDFDIIEVLRQMDKDAEIEGTSSITPYLITLFQPKKRAEITRKMLLPPLEAQEDPEMGGTDASDVPKQNQTANREPGSPETTGNNGMPLGLDQDQN